MNELQITKIKKYLESKNLSNDIFSEIFDHFISQVSNLMATGNKSFATAFFETKKKWQNEFIPVKKSVMSFKTVPKIVKYLYQQQEKTVKRSAVFFGLIIAFLQVLIAMLSDVGFSVISNSLLGLVSFTIIVISGFSMLIFSGKNVTSVLGMYFRTNLLCIISAFFILEIFKNFLDFPKNIHKIFYDSINSSQFPTAEFLAVISLYCAQNILLSYLIIYLYQYFKRKNKLESSE